MISVIIPVRNAESTIKESVQSVQSQNCEEDIEILVVINGCTDRTESIIRDIAKSDNRIRVLYSNPGIVPALNTGLKYSQGNYIARQDADDVWIQGKLKKQIDFLKANKDISVLGTQLRVVDVFNNPMYVTDYPINHEEIRHSLLHGTNPIGHPSVIFQKHILDKLAGYQDIFPYAEDMDLWARAIRWYKFANLNESLVIYKHCPNLNYNSNTPIALSRFYKSIS